MRTPIPRSPPKPMRGPLGCVALLVLFVVEIAAGGFTIWAVHGVTLALFERLGVRLAPDDAGLAGVFLGFLVAAPLVWAIDAWCKRRTGRSVMDELPFIP